MIKEIHFIYILDPSGNPIFIRENYVQGSEEFNHSLLSGFITALQSFASEFGGEELRIADLGNKTIFAKVGEKTGFQFILVTEKKVKHDKMLGILEQIHALFLEKFAQYSKVDDEKKREIMGSFIIDLNHILEPDDKLTGLFKS